MNLEELRRLREDTPGCRERIHLNNAGASLMPTPVVEAIVEHLQLERTSGGYEAFSLQHGVVEDAYTTLAELLGAKARNIAFTDSATSSYARALSAIPFQQDDVLLTTTNDYVSNQIMFLSLAARSRVKVIHVADTESGEIDLSDLERKICVLRPRLIAVTHVPTNSGLVQPVEAIGRIAADHEVTYLVDACQSVGQRPLDVTRIQCDFLCATSRKFLRGPRGSGFLYVGDRALERGLTPLLPDMRGAAWLDAHRFEPVSTARRFEYWEQAYALLLGTKAATEYALRLGIERITARACGLAAALRERMSAAGLQVLDRGSEKAAIVTVAIPDREPKAFHAELQRRGVNTSISYRELATIDFADKGVDWAIRLSPHYYNTEAEIDKAADIVTRLARSTT